MVACFESFNARLGNGNTKVRCDANRVGQDRVPIVSVQREGDRRQKLRAFLTRLDRLLPRRWMEWSRVVTILRTIPTLGGIPYGERHIGDSLKNEAWDSLAELIFWGLVLLTLFMG